MKAGRRAKQIGGQDYQVPGVREMISSKAHVTFERRDMRQLLKVLACPGTRLGIFLTDLEVLWEYERISPKRRFIEYEFPQIRAVAVAMGLFTDPRDHDVRDKAHTWFTESGLLSEAGRSHFGKLLRRYNSKLVEVCGVVIELYLHGRGHSRRFIVRAELSQRALSHSQISGNERLNLRGSPKCFTRET
jgi:hypothetical protein